MTNYNMELPICARDGCDNHVKRKDKKYCSISCGTLVRNQKQYPTRKILICQNEKCGKEYTTKPAKEDRSKFCSQKCKYEYQETLTGQKHHNYTSVTKECENCGKNYICEVYESDTRRFCGLRCRRVWFVNNRRPRGIDYGPTWEKQRNKCLKRDSYKCRICKKDIKEVGTKNLHVHHIIKFKETQDNRLSNLITLCREHHIMVEHGQIGCPKP